jgi:hypothetical protein
VYVCMCVCVYVCMCVCVYVWVYITHTPTHPDNYNGYKIQEKKPKVTVSNGRKTKV